MSTIPSSASTSSTSPTSTQVMRTGEAYLSKYLGLFGTPLTKESKAFLALHLYEHASRLAVLAEEVRAAAMLASSKELPTATAPGDLSSGGRENFIDCSIVLQAGESALSPWPEATTCLHMDSLRTSLHFSTEDGGVDLSFNDPRSCNLTWLFLRPSNLDDGKRMANFFINLASAVLQAGADEEQQYS